MLTPNIIMYYVLFNDLDLTPDYDYDFVVTQPIFNMSYNTMDLLRRYNPEKVIIYPSYYLSSYHFPLTYVAHGGNILHQPIDYHYREIVSSYNKGMSVDEIYETICDFDVSDQYIEDITLTNLKHTQTNLEQFRNICPNIIDHHDFVLSNYRNHRLGYSMNHPTPFYLNWLIDQVQTYIPFEKINSELDMFKNIDMPMYPKLLSHFNFETHNQFVFNELRMNIKEMVGYYVDTYNKLSSEDREILTSFVS